MKRILVGLAILTFSTSAAFAAKVHHTKKPAAPAEASAPAPTHLFVVSDADKALYEKNKRESGVK
jgi:hypothetical protein